MDAAPLRSGPGPGPGSGGGAPGQESRRAGGLPAGGGGRAGGPAAAAVLLLAAGAQAPRPAGGGAEPGLGLTPCSPAPRQRPRPLRCAPPTVGGGAPGKWVRGVGVKKFRPELNHRREKGDRACMRLKRLFSCPGSPFSPPTRRSLSLEGRGMPGLHGPAGKTRRPLGPRHSRRQPSGLLARPWPLPWPGRPAPQVSTPTPETSGLPHTRLPFRAAATPQGCREPLASPALLESRRLLTPSHLPRSIKFKFQSLRPRDTQPGLSSQ